MIHDVDDQMEMERALREWQAARRAIFVFPMTTPASPEQLRLWERLGNAEDALMKIEV
jgi:hypothetical protein